MNNENHLGLFTKYWTPGKVKTRLAASVGHDQASRIHFELLSHVVAQCGNSGDQRWLVFDPLSHQQDFEQLGADRWNVCAQSSGDLGRRMRNFFHQQFFGEKGSGQSEVARKIVVIGADCPQLDAAQIETVFAILENIPVVIGPSADGGYYLIGIKQPKPELLANLFDEIDWGTSRVISQTLAVLEEAQVEFELLPEMTDVDDIHDLTGLVNVLYDRMVTASATESELQLLSRLKEVLSTEHVDSRFVRESGADA